MHMQQVIGTSPRPSKHSLKTVLSQTGNGSSSVGHPSSTGKKTGGSYKQETDSIVINSNNLIISRGRPTNVESTARASASNILGPNQMNYSKTLTQHLQN